MQPGEFGLKKMTIILVILKKSNFMSNIHHIIQQLNEDQANRFLELIFERIEADASNHFSSVNSDKGNGFQPFFEGQNTDDMTRIILHSIAVQDDAYGQYFRNQLLFLESKLEAQRAEGPMRGGGVDILLYSLAAISILGSKVRFEKGKDGIKFQIDTGLLAIPELAGIFKALKSRIEGENKTHITITDSKNIIVSSEIRAGGDFIVGDQKKAKDNQTEKDVD